MKYKRDLLNQEFRAEEDVYSPKLSFVSWEIRQGNYFLAVFHGKAFKTRIIGEFTSRAEREEYRQEYIRRSEQKKRHEVKIKNAAQAVKEGMILWVKYDDREVRFYKIVRMSKQHLYIQELGREVKVLGYRIGVIRPTDELVGQQEGHIINKYGQVRIDGRIGRIYDGEPININIY
jgi:TusA-related sulfurtransferase